MILSDLIGSEVHDASGAKLGRVVDARFRLEGSGTPSQARLVGVIVSPRSATSFLGYERTGMSRPALVARLLQFMHRGSFLVLWADIARIGTDRVDLRAGFERQPSVLESAD